MPSPWDAAVHPRADAGSAAGGEFKPASAPAAQEKKPAAKKEQKQQQQQQTKGTLGYKTGYGKRGGDARVRDVQTALNKLGLTDGHGKKLAVDGQLGPLTTQSIKKAQKALGEKPTGVVTPAFMKRLTSLKSLHAATTGKKQKMTIVKTKTAAPGKGATTGGKTNTGTPVGKGVVMKGKAMDKRESVIQDGGRVVEAKADDNAGGRVFRMRVIKYGDSRNRRRYPEAVMREAVGLYEGAKAYDHHRADAELRSSTVGGLVGWYEGAVAEADGLYADLHLLPSAHHVAEALDATLALQARGLQPLVGTSHDVSGNFRPVPGTGRGMIQEATAITAVSSVDIVANPAAGGQAVRAVAGGDDEHEEETEMDLEQMLATLAEASDEQLASAGLARAPENGGGDGEDETDNTTEDDKEPAGAGAAKEAEEVSVTETDGLAKNSALGRMTIKAMIGETRLPTSVTEGVIEALPERFTEADVAAQIKQLQAVYAAMEKGGLLKAEPAAAGPGEGIVREGLDKKRDALDAFFSGDFGKGYWSFRQAYMDVTGRQPRSFTEDFNRTILRESIGRFDSQERATESMDSTTWNLVLGDSITRRMVAEYERPSLQTWRRIVSQTTPVNDFRTQRIDRIGGYGVLPAVNQGATYQPLTSPSNEEVTYAISKRGGTEDITLEMIANDDVRSISRIPTKLGRAAAQTLYRFVWEMVNPATNPVIYDGVTLYHANHGNTATTAFGQSALSTARQKMRDQAAYGDSLEILGYVPKILLVPNELEELAWELVTASVALPSGAPVGAASDVPNIHQGLELVVLDYWTDATNWAVIADPSQCPTIEMGFYQGRDTPELFTQSDPTQGSMFDADKLTYKIRHIYSGTVLDYRAFQGFVVAG